MTVLSPGESQQPTVFVVTCALQAPYSDILYYPF